MKHDSILLVSLILCMGAIFTLRAEEEHGEPAAATRTEQDRHALEVGRKVIRIKAALEHPEKKESMEAVRSLGLDSRYYVMVRGWIVQHINMTKSYRGTSTYKQSDERKKTIESRIVAYQRLLRAIDLE